MGIKNIIIAALILLFSAGFQFKAHCQLFFPEDMVNVKGQVIDEITKEGVINAQVLNMRVRGGTMTDAFGKFSIQADPMDTLTLNRLITKTREFL